MVDIFGNLVQNIYYNFFFIPRFPSKLQNSFALSYTNQPIYDTVISANNVNKIIIIFQNSQFLFLYFFFTIHPEYQGCRNNMMQTKEEEKKLFMWDFLQLYQHKKKKKFKSVIKPFYTLSAKTRYKKKKWRCIISTSSPS